jgi:hypothetical protein
MWPTVMLRDRSQDPILYVDTEISREWHEDLQQLTQACSVSWRALTGETKLYQRVGVFGNKVQVTGSTSPVFCMSGSESSCRTVAQ